MKLDFWKILDMWKIKVKSDILRVCTLFFELFDTYFTATNINKKALLVKEFVNAFPFFYLFESDGSFITIYWNNLPFSTLIHKMNVNLTSSNEMFLKIGDDLLMFGPHLSNLL